MKNNRSATKSKIYTPSHSELENWVAAEIALAGHNPVPRNRELSLELELNREEWEGGIVPALNDGTPAQPSDPH